MKSWQDHIKEILVYVEAENEETVRNLILDFLLQVRGAGYKSGYDDALSDICNFANEARLTE